MRPSTNEPSGKYDVFFRKLCELVEGISAAVERRHGPESGYLCPK